MTDALRRLKWQFIIATKHLMKIDWKFSKFLSTKIVTLSTLLILAVYSVAVGRVSHELRNRPLSLSLWLSGRASELAWNPIV